MIPRVLIIAGSDSGGGAGIQADIKTVTALGGYAATAVTAITVQDTCAVHAVYPVPDEIIAQQIRAVLSDLGADAIKIGMVGSASAATAIAAALAMWPDIPLVLDPVLVATSGDALGDGGVVDVLKTRLIPRAHILTPNVPEAERLTGLAIKAPDDLKAAAEALLTLGARGVMAKAGHLSGDVVEDLYVEDGLSTAFPHARLATQHTHGTGCTLASAIATGLAEGRTAVTACARAVAYVTAAITHAPGLGGGHGPLNHALVFDAISGQFVPAQRERTTS